MKNRLLICLLLMISPGIATTQPNDLPDSMELVTETELLSLFADMSTGDFAVVDRRTGFTWRCIPPDAGNDPVARGIYKMNLRSHLWIDLTDQKAVAYYRNSFTGSVRKDAVVVDPIESGIRVTFTFPSEEIVIPVEYTLGKDYLAARIVVSEIREHPDATLMSIGLIPFFGAGSTSDEGYLFVPDGSGGIIDFNNRRQAYAEFDEPVYGRDSTQSVTLARTTERGLPVPTFGIRNGDNAMLAVITEGDYSANIRANVSGAKTSYNHVFAEFQFARSANVELKGIDRSVRNIPKVVQPEIPLPYYEVRFFPLPGEIPGYVEMAERYRRFLQEERNFTTKISVNGLPMYGEFVGGVEKTVSVLGIPIRKVVPFTTFAEGGSIATDLVEGGVTELVLRYTNWMRDIEGSRVPRRFHANRALGGNADLSALAELEKTGSISLYLDAGIVSFLKSGNGYSRHTDTARTVSRLPAIVYRYRLSTWERDPETLPRYLLDPELIDDAVIRWSDAAMASGYANLSFPRLGSILYSDFADEGSSRTRAGEIIRGTLEDLDLADRSLLLPRAQGYAFPYVSHIIDTPIVSSGYQIVDRSVPFLQIVLHGYVSYAGPAINFSSDPWYIVLKSLETGSAPYFVWAAAEPSVLSGSGHGEYFAANFYAFRDDAIRYYAILADVLGPVSHEEITGHRSSADGVAETDYGETVTVVVNYNSHPVARYGATIPGRSFRIFENASGDLRQ